MFRPELVKIVAPGHGLVKLAKIVDRDRMDELFGQTYCPDNGRPGVSTRLMVALHYLKFSFNLSDDDVVTGWVENPYWQYLSGMQLFEADFADTLEKVFVETVESGAMTKDLALLAGNGQPFLTTEALSIKYTPTCGRPCNPGSHNASSE